MPLPWFWYFASHTVHFPSFAWVPPVCASSSPSYVSVHVASVHLYFALWPVSVCSYPATVVSFPWF